MNCMHNLARTWKHLGHLDESIALFEECINLSNKVLGPEHQSTQTTLNCLLRTKGQRGDGDFHLGNKE
ncbi:hypothetical protein AN0972.2 [Aspergillus nidulans FGSC A4]|uniref:Uncharacterized protein n=2 Tax=Emericella nidulans TaxID=162425 RepID=Q5BEQ8_EMENI|nr:hypothetical protein [Aspergillus nidulans FGSC A4]EAA66001.1 hypothetical protein AN0972.2 [Aspergillus nidulans FGSC A4]CBF88419.1 TPA: ORF Fragment [Source:UniProtKB/TrEMBL;Acc:Q7LVX2] [Aspergillus nidulans FGSC A4]|eukprot:XP_658576.1 hypothetical protein AN0972.2 [Aspergillus nidulans FGSC A4]